jgi:hypothetical protein
MGAEGVIRRLVIMRIDKVAGYAFGSNPPYEPVTYRSMTAFRRRGAGVESRP